ncbi:MAG TPA: ATP-grasp domain-containing protein [Candidatus Paceibacterota bacterium]|nr:ATP-grasp domain-containing protein [Candidatus Paceibacterota bacterium]
MKQSPYSPLQWKEIIPDIEEVLREMDATPILSVGITPYTRILPSFFLNNYSIYGIKRSSDVDILEQYISIHTLEDHHKALAQRIHGTNYLLGNHAFQAFLKSRSKKPIVMLTTTDEKSISTLEGLALQWIGNAPSTIQNVKHKGEFRDLIEKLGLPSLPSHYFNRDEFLDSVWVDIRDTVGGSFVVQRADKEVGGNEGTFFVHDDSDFRRCIAALIPDATFSRVLVSRFVEGHSTSMLGCVTQKGILSGPLQLQLIDVPESLHHVAPNGIFFGNDIGFRDWDDDVEATAQRVIEGIGEHLRAQGYKGIFGIDFLYDRNTKEIFPIECNPRFTGSLALYSLMLLEAGLPPLEFFHLLSHLNIESSFHFDTVNKALKQRIPCAHIAFSPKGITSMEVPLLAGVYEYDASASEQLRYIGKGISLADLKNKNQFLLMDTVLSLGSSIEQSVPRLFKFMFPYGIAKSSYEIEGRAGFLVRRFADVLLQAVEDKKAF